MEDEKEGVKSDLMWHGAIKYERWCTKLLFELEKTIRSKE